MAATTINPGSGNTTRYYDAPTLSLPDSDWCIGIWYRPNIPSTAARLWDTGGSGVPNACYARVSHDAAGTGVEQQFGFRFIANGGSGTAVVDRERNPNFSTGWATDTDFLLVVQRRSGNLEGHCCVKGGETSSWAPVAWSLGALSPGTEFRIGGASSGSNLLVNPYGEFFFLSGSSLSAAQIDTLKAGAPITAITATPTRYYKLRESNDPEPDLGTAEADADQNGTGWTTTTEFFADPAAARASVQGKAIRLDRTSFANQTDLTALIYHAEPSEANPNPVEVIGNLTTDADGNYDWEITHGSLVNGSDVWVIAIKDSSPEIISAMRTTVVVA